MSTVEICIEVRWNHSDLSGCAPRVSAGWAVTRKQGVGSEERLTCRVKITDPNPLRGPQHANQALTSRMISLRYIEPLPSFSPMD